VTHPDLFDQSWAKAALLAEQLQNHKLTRAEAMAQLTEVQSQITAEEQRRNLANRSVATQETAATPALISSGPTICNRVGNTRSAIEMNVQVRLTTAKPSRAARLA
jgi:hypothetical protein